MNTIHHEQEQITAIAQKYGFSLGAIGILMQALRQGNGSAAQFNHPELGGMGQWMANGMIMLGDWNNQGLKARIAAACTELAGLLAAQPATPSASTGRADRAEFAPFPRDSWWPTQLGQPNASGAQNGIRYAYFALAQRLLIEAQGRISAYDTGEHQIQGVAQQQGGTTSLTFRSQKGDVALSQLRQVEV